MAHPLWLAGLLQPQALVNVEVSLVFESVELVPRVLLLCRLHHLGRLIGCRSYVLALCAYC